MEVLGAEKRRPRFLGYVSNVSLTGAFVQCATPRPAGTQLDLRLRLPGSPPAILQAQVEVVWTRGYQGRHGPPAGMGLRFGELSEAARGEIRRFCEDSDPVLHPVLDAAQID